MNKILIVLGAITLIIASILIQYSILDIDDTERKSFSMTSSSGGLRPLAMVTCTPDSGYDYCDAEQYVFAYAEVQYTGHRGKQGYGYIDGANRWYYVKEVYINVKFEGDYLYASNSPYWPTCTSSGCNWPRISPGKYVVVTAPSKSVPEISFVAWDKDYSSSGSMYWAWVGAGFYGFDTYVIGCYDASDCGSNEYCDKSGSWNTWSCKVDPCETMPAAENICDGFDLWSQKCVYGEYVKDQLIEENSLTCNCIIQETPNTCVGFDLWSQKQATPCIVGLIPNTLIDAESVECGYQCTEGETQGFECTDDTYVITQQCINNEWIDVNEESCPLNWINLEMILRDYIEDIKTYLEELL